jgi:hypothetical protein
LIAAKTGRPIASEVLGVSLGAAGVLFQIALAMSRPGENPLRLMDRLAETWRALDADIAQELPEAAP